MTTKSSGRLSAGLARSTIAFRCMFAALAVLQIFNICFFMWALVATVHASVDESIPIHDSWAKMSVQRALFLPRQTSQWVTPA
jgi:hypothetical protein